MLGSCGQVAALAKSSLEVADSDRVRADAEQLLARAAHAQSDYPGAYAHYRQVGGKLCCAQRPQREKMAPYFRVEAWPLPVIAMHAAGGQPGCV